MRSKWITGLIIFYLIFNLISSPVFAANSLQNKMTDVLSGYEQVEVEADVPQEQTNEVETDQVQEDQDDPTNEEVPSDEETDKIINEPEVNEENRFNIEFINQEFNTGQTIHFNDENLEMVIRKVLDKPEGEVFADDLLRITKLIANDLDIQDITGLEYATNLRVLYLNNNQISDITPLILNSQNGGFRQGTYINLCNNALDCNVGSNTIKVIEKLIQMGVSVDYDKVCDSKQLKLNKDLKELKMIGDKIFEDSKRQILLQYKDKNSKNKIITNFSSKIEKIEALTDDVEIIAIKENENIEALINELEKDESILHVERNRLLEYHQAPNDTFYSYQWGLKNIKAEEAWATILGMQKSVTVAVIDSGIDYYHEDLVNRIAPGGWDFFYNDDSPVDFIGHGTAVAGVIAAETNNYAGMAGVAGILNVKVLPLCVSNTSGAILDSAIINAIDYAIAKKVDVINLSMGSNVFSSIENSAIQRAIQSGIVVIASAGNDGNSSYNYPASYDNVISVGSIDDTNTRSSFSTYNDKVTVVAPGQNILSTAMGWINGESSNYSYATGTSFSAPMVSGIAAVLKAVNPSMTTEQIKDRIQTTAVDLGVSGKDNYYGYGKVNFFGALGTVSTGSLNAQVTYVEIPSSVRPGQNFNITVTVKNTGTEDWLETSQSQIKLGIRGAVEARGLIPGGMIRPGESCSLPVSLTAPNTVGNMNLTLQMLKEGVEWFGETKSIVVNVTSPSDPLDVQITNISYPNVKAGQSFTLSVTVANTGSETWTEADNIRLRISGTNLDLRSYLPSGACIPSGQSHTFSTDLTAPATAGTWQLTIQMIKEGVMLFGPTVQIPIDVTATPALSVMIIGQDFPSDVTVGQSFTGTVTVTNTGSETWTAASNVRLRISGSNYDTRSYLPSGTSVAPGQSYTFSANLTAPATAGTWPLTVQMIKEGVMLFGPTMQISINVTAATPLAAIVNSVNFPASVTAGQSFTGTVTVTNTGSETWTAANNVRLRISGSSLDTRSYLPSGTSIAPGQSYTFSTNLKAPYAEGLWTLTAQMIKEGIMLFGPTMQISINVTAFTPITPLSAAIDSVNFPASVTAGQSVTGTVTVTNTGSETWTAENNVRLRISGVNYDTRSYLPSGTSVAPGQSYTFSANLTAPAAGGEWILTVQLIKEGVMLFGPASQIAVDVTI